MSEKLFKLIFLYTKIDIYVGFCKGEILRKHS